MFPPERPLEFVYDLKGSTFGKKVELKEIYNFVILKDLNLLETKIKMLIKKEDAFNLIKQI